MYQSGAGVSSGNGCLDHGQDDDECDDGDNATSNCAACSHLYMILPRQNATLTIIWNILIIIQQYVK